MKGLLLRTVLVLASTFLINTVPDVWAEELNTELSAATKGGIGCAILTGITMLGSLAAGPGELIMIAGGGSLAPSSTAPLMVSLTATSYVAACGIGISATPATLWFIEQAGIFLDRVWGINQSPADNTYHQGDSILAVSENLPHNIASDGVLPR